MGLDTNVRQALAALHMNGAVEPVPEVEFDLRRLLLVVWRAKWLMALLAALGAAAGGTIRGQGYKRLPIR